MHLNLAKVHHVSQRAPTWLDGADSHTAGLSFVVHDSRPRRENVLFNAECERRLLEYSIFHTSVSFYTISSIHILA